MATHSFLISPRTTHSSPGTRHAMPSAQSSVDATQLLANLRAAIGSDDAAKARETLVAAVELDAGLPMAWEVETAKAFELTPCEMAASKPSAEMLELLLEFVTQQPAESASSAISFWQRVVGTATRSGQTASLQLVLSKIGNDNVREAVLESYTALFEAIRKDKPELMRLLTDHGASLERIRNPQGQCALHVAVENDAEKCFNEVLTNSSSSSSSLKNTADRHGHTPLHYAAEFGRVNMAKQLLLAGANPNVHSAVQQLTPLHLAVRNARVEVVKVLLEGNGGASADPNAIGIGGKTPLHDVFSIDLDTLEDAQSDDEDEDHAEAVQCDLLQALLESGADPNVLDASPGFSALHLAIRGECERAIELLLEHKANPNVRTSTGGLTALHIAASFDASVDVWKNLLDAGADSSIKDDTGKRAVELLVDEDKASELAELL